VVAKSPKGRSTRREGEHSGSVSSATSYYTAPNQFKDKEENRGGIFDKAQAQREDYSQK
jgi:hypothetical protein